MYNKVSSVSLPTNNYIVIELAAEPSWPLQRSIKSRMVECYQCSTVVSIDLTSNWQPTLYDVRFSICWDCLERNTSILYFRVFSYVWMCEKVFRFTMTCDNKCLMNKWRIIHQIQLMTMAWCWIVNQGQSEDNPLEHGKEEKTWLAIDLTLQH